MTGSEMPDCSEPVLLNIPVHSIVLSESVFRIHLERRVNARSKGVIS